MPNLTTRFSLADQMSAGLEKISQAGMNMVDEFQRAEAAANSAFDGISSGVTSAVSSVSGVATSLDKLQTSTTKYGSAAGDAAAQTDYWTDAVGNYDKSLLEAINSTEELVEAGFKSSDALEEQNRMIALCEQSFGELSQSISAATSIQDEMESAVKKADSAMESLAGNEKVSAQTKSDLADASEQAARAMQELENAQKAADDALAAYNRTMNSGTSNLDELEAAAEKAGHAAEELAAANGKATTAMDQLSAATGAAQQEAEKAGGAGVGAIEGVASALSAAGITAAVSEITGQVYEMANSFSEAEKIIAGSTGASEEELAGLQAQAERVFSNSSAESLSEVATSLTAVRKSTGLAGDALEEATNAGMALESVLGYDIPESARTASTLMKNFNLTAEEAYNLIAIGAQSGADKNGDLLDVLNEYAPQYAAIGLSAEQFVDSLITGAEEGVFSIDKLADSVKEFNIRAKDGSDTTAEAFESLGMDADVMASRFAAGGETAATAFFEVVNALNAMTDPVQRNQTAVNLFGTQFEDLQGTALPVLASIQTSSLETYDAIGQMSEEAISMSDKWQQASNSIGTAFGSVLSPKIESASNAVAGFVDGIGKFLQKNPVVTKVITALGVGIGVAATAIAGMSAAVGVYTAATTIAAAVTTAFGTSVATAFLPITAIVAGVAALAAGIALLSDSMNDADEETLTLTATTRDQIDELDKLTAQYDAACEKYGETSEQASSLRYQVDTLSASIEENGQSIEELANECDQVISKSQELRAQYEENSASAEDNALKNLALITRLEELSEGTANATTSQVEMEGILNSLNSSIDGLNMSYEDLISNQEGGIATIKEMAKAQAELQTQQAKMDRYTELLQLQAEQEKKLSKVTDERTAAQERYNKASDEYTEALARAGYDTTGASTWATMFSAEADEAKAAEEALNSATESQENLQSELDKTNSEISELEQYWEDVGAAAEEAAQNPENYQQAAAYAYQSVQAEVEELAQAYDDAYQAALESFQGQFGLFDEASTESETYMESTVANAQAAMESQLAYWDSYLANITALKNTSAEDLGITQQNYEALMSYVQTGSAEAAGLASSMVQAINSGNEEAVAELATTIGEVQAKQEEAAATTADWQTNFTEQMQGYAEEMSSIITNDMNLSDEAKASATSTVNSYANAILAGKSSAVEAAKQVAQSVASALASSSPTVTVNVKSSTTVPGNANGTTNAESVFIAGENGPELVARRAAAYASGTTTSSDYFIAGEHGPELIVGEQGSTVFPASETDRLIDALNEKRQPLAVLPAESSHSEPLPSTSPSSSEKKIVLEIAGSGSIQVTGNGNADRTTILDVLTENLKPVLMNIIQGEIYEEGDLSYDY